MRKPFLGWFVVAGAFLVLSLHYGVQFSYGVFLPHMLNELEWDRSTLAAPFSLYVLMYTGLSFFAGRLTDRLGPRIVIVIGALGLGSGYMSMSTIEEVWEPYVYLAMASLGGAAAFVPCNATVIRWFVRRRGLALGLASSGISFAAVVGPPIAVVLIQAADWRKALLIMGAGAAVLMLAASRLMHRDPESIGLVPDAASDSVPETVLEQEGWTLKAARRTSAFWVLMACLFITWLAIFVPFVHLTGHALERGLSPVESALLLTFIGVGGLLGRVIGGGMTDRFGRLPGIVIAILLQTSAFAGFTISDSFLWLAVWAMAFGVGYSGVSVLFPALFGDLFGRAHAGAIVGFVFAVGGGSAAAGPYFAGAVFDATGGYQVAFITCAVLNLVALALLAFLRPPGSMGGEHSSRNNI